MVIGTLALTGFPLTAGILHGAIIESPMSRKSFAYYRSR